MTEQAKFPFKKFQDVFFLKTDLSVGEGFIKTDWIQFEGCASVEKKVITDQAYNSQKDYGCLTHIPFDKIFLTKAGVVLGYPDLFKSQEVEHV